MKRRTGFFLFVFMFLLIAAGAGPAQAGIVEFLFPSLRTAEPDPSETLKAPFAEPDNRAGPSASPSEEQGIETALPENDIPLDTPHRNSEQIGEWLVMAASEAMTFEKDNYKDALAASAPLFNADGRGQYEAFLQENNFIRVLDSGQYHIRSFVKEIPLLLNEGALEGRYRWLYEVQMMVSYMDRKMKNYKNAEPVNQLVTLTIQVGRTSDLETGKDVIIERWAGKFQPVSKR